VREGVLGQYGAGALPAEHGPAVRRQLLAEHLRTAQHPGQVAAELGTEQRIGAGGQGPAQQPTGVEARQGQPCSAQLPHVAVPTELHRQCRDVPRHVGAGLPAHGRQIRTVLVGDLGRGLVAAGEAGSEHAVPEL
jgi:hypothetical protein